MGPMERLTMVVGEGKARYYPSQVLSLQELQYWIAFSRVRGIGPVRFRKLLTYFQDDVAAAWKADQRELQAAGLEPKTATSFLRQRGKIEPAQELERLDRRRIQVITWKDPTYPPLLREIDYAPPVLHVCGHLTEDDYNYTLAIVGTRSITTYGREVTDYFASQLATKMTIISGLALGVDTVAHTAALDAGGRTIAVLACGLDNIYPPQNYELARRIVESGQGALISAFPLGVRPDSGNFPARNHLISGLSLGVLVTEAPESSGALITTTSALNQGREVFAVPGNITSPSSRGTNKLIQDGAYPATCIEDIIHNLNLHNVPLLAPELPLPDIPNSSSTPQPKSPTPERPESPDSSPQSPLSQADTEEERLLLALLGQEPIHIDELTRETDLTAAQVSAALTVLEIKGIIRQIGSMRYVLS
ncbi:DNA processing protein [Thermosporothrix hazakensis]|uniref:DNA processing protein n=1 Tax=Thermosporothrix hazakensis TaxID=644383 RepID=A0A326U381_THEHA|nr:DNA-processing protein DprA [Thermosporothrix hazakensis]PZW26379.1 DNA processing protein [Thermosporothrix hazakensis]GCE48669.1 DNA processing protein DprA [Thermosporothrix hazakensis]